MDDRSKTIQLIRMKGPVLPSNINKELGRNLLFTSVILAELVSSKQLKLTSLKIGSSPLYYLPGQESRLELFYKHLNEKDRRTFDLLKEKKVLRDSDQDPLVRVSLTQIKDFAYPLDVTIKGAKERFWKWHSLTNEQAAEKIREILLPPGPSLENPALLEKEQLINQNTVPAREPPKERKDHIDEQLKKENLLSPRGGETDISGTGEKTADKHIKSATLGNRIEPASLNQPKTQPSPPKEHKENQKTLLLEETYPDDPFFLAILSFFKKHTIHIVSFETEKKGKDYSFSLIITTGFGQLPYYCRAKDKKRISDPDIAQAFVQAQMKKLPLLYLTTGEPTKKAKEMLHSEYSVVTFVTFPGKI